jgi:hypothetical protein
MDWAIDWSGLPTVCDMLGLDDIETAVRLMRMIITEEKKLAKSD